MNITKKKWSKGFYFSSALLEKHGFVLERSHFTNLTRGD